MAVATTPCKICYKQQPGLIDSMDKVQALSIKLMESAMFTARVRLL